MLKNFIDLLEPCAAFTQLVSSDEYETFSSAIPCIKELKLHLENCSGMTGLNGVTTPMLEDLKEDLISCLMKEILIATAPTF
jgi:hypothetical protein